MSATTAVSMPLPSGMQQQLPGAAALLDPQRLLELWGTPATPHYLRYKPGTSLVVALDTATGPAWGAYHCEPAKMGKLPARAVRHDQPFVQATDRMALGALALDKAVGRGYRKVLHGVFDGVLAAGRHSGLKVLRYNPFRRAVLLLDGTAGPQAVARVGRRRAELRVDVLRQLHTAGLAAPARTADHDAGVLLLGWQPGTVVDSVSSNEQLSAVHDLLMRLQQIDPVDRSLPIYDKKWWRDSLELACAGLTDLDPGLGVRACEVAGSLPDPPDSEMYLVHGDFSIDQVVWRAGQPAMIDFDRLGLGPQWWDRASLLATECLYAGHGGPADGRSIIERRGAAHAVLRRASEPFRRIDSQWPTSIAARLDLAAELAQ